MGIEPNTVKKPAHYCGEFRKDFYRAYFARMRVPKDALDLMTEEQKAALLAQRLELAERLDKAYDEHFRKYRGPLETYFYYGTGSPAKDSLRALDKAIGWSQHEVGRVLSYVEGNRRHGRTPLIDLNSITNALEGLHIIGTALMGENPDVDMQTVYDTWEKKCNPGPG